MRVVSWNVHNRSGAAAVQLGEFLASLSPRPDIVLLQEVNQRAVEPLRDAAGLDWLRHSMGRFTPEPVSSGRRLGVAVGGMGREPQSFTKLAYVPLWERILITSVPVLGTTVTVATYHAPPGVNWHEKKAEQAVGFTRWLNRVRGPVLFGADANTPDVDAIDFADTLTHWRTGRKALMGSPGDDVLFGPTKTHRLDDALRRWLGDHPEELENIKAERPNGPLAVSHRTGGRGQQRTIDRRYDAIWVSADFKVKGVEYPYDASCAAGSDHSAVVVDLGWANPAETCEPKEHRGTNPGLLARGSSALRGTSPFSGVRRSRKKAIGARQAGMCPQNRHRSGRAIELCGHRGHFR